MRVCILADLPGHSVATTSTCMMKLKRFDEIRTRGKITLKTNFRDGFSAFRNLLTKLERQFTNEIGASNFKRNYGTLTMMVWMLPCTYHQGFLSCLAPLDRRADVTASSLAVKAACS